MSFTYQFLLESILKENQQPENETCRLLKKKREMQIHKQNGTNAPTVALEYMPPTLYNFISLRPHCKKGSRNFIIFALTRCQNVTIHKSNYV